MNQNFFNPKFYLSIGGFLGFSIALTSGLLAGNEIGIVLRDSSLGCLIGAILLRRFLHVMHANICSARLEKGKDTDSIDDNREGAKRPTAVTS